jgi:transcriptional regulator with XRE-family HTH domain
MSAAPPKAPEANRPRRTLGPVLKQHRRALGLSQLELAKRLGVEAGYISSMEADRRRPSLTLVRRLADILRIERETLFLLSHPEAKLLVGKRPSRQAPPEEDRAWREFKANETLLARHNVKPEELALLSQVRRLGKIRDKRDFLQILNSIRQALED